MSLPLTPVARFPHKDATHGVCEVPNEGEAVVYVPDPGYIGADRCVYSACNKDGYCDSAVVAITVGGHGGDAPDQDALPSADGPTVNPDVIATVMDVPVVKDVLASGSQDLTLKSPSGGEGGVCAVTDDSRILYTPNRGYAGHDACAFVVCGHSDGDYCRHRRVGVIVRPVASVIEAETGQGTSAAFFLDKMFDLESTEVQISFVPTDGVLRSEGDKVIYTPDSGFVGTEEIEYTLCTVDGPVMCDKSVFVIVVAPAPQEGSHTDGVANGAGEHISAPQEGSNTASVVNAVNDRGYTVRDSGPASFYVLENDSSDSGEGLVVDSILYAASNGSCLVADGAGSVAYTPDNGFVGEDRCVYLACAAGGEVCDSAVLSIIVEPSSVELDGMVQEDLLPEGTDDSVPSDRGSRPGHRRGLGRPQAEEGALARRRGPGRRRASVPVPLLPKGRESVGHRRQSDETAGAVAPASVRGRRRREHLGLGLLDGRSVLSCLFSQ